ncbi:f239f9d1-a883-4313-8aed-2ceda5a3e2f8 [Thermothielavioides terrestris]|uniref:F239f9d1-a883-4313-8aed-2ceda5a3e2f8 n=1 Tax=Thermothielavioides terrestris TaxID=2587410 RepID=A0A446B573_9PEZI|nr:f239f9d1-a883-4313-8aed-2ceda5a3e2f8 [Thermothielavioides terrestris]
MAQRSRTVAERFADASVLLSRIQFKYGVVGDEVDDELTTCHMNDTYQYAVEGYRGTAAERLGEGGLRILGEIETVLQAAKTEVDQMYANRMRTISTNSYLYVAGMLPEIMRGILAICLVYYGKTDANSALRMPINQLEQRARAVVNANSVQPSCTPIAIFKDHSTKKIIITTIILHRQPDQHCPPDAMEATSSAVARLRQRLTVARKRVGCARAAGGPFKPIAQGFINFFESLFASVAMANADVIGTFAHFDMVGNEEEQYEVAITAKATPTAAVPANEIAIEGSTAEAADLTEQTVGEEVPVAETPAVPAELTPPQQETETPTCGAEVAEVAENISVVDTTTVPAATDEPVAEVTAAETEVEDAPAVESASVAAEGQDSMSEALVTESALATDDISVAEEMAEFPIEAPAIETISTSAVHDENCTTPTCQDEEPVHQLTENAPDDDIVAEQQNDVKDCDETVEDLVKETEAAPESSGPEEPAQNTEETGGNMDAKHGSEDDTIPPQDAVPALEQASEESSDEEDIAGEIISEADTIDKANNNAPATSADLAVPKWPLIFEDDFDAAASSVFDHQFTRLMDIDYSWSIPHIGERIKTKRETERELVRQTLTSWLPTRAINLQDLLLEQAARGPSTNPTTKGATPAEKDATPADFVATKKEADTRPTSEDTGATVDLADAIPAGRSHSRSPSSSSSESQLTSGSASENEACPGTPEIVATYPVPGKELRDFEVEYAVLTNGEVWYHYPGTGEFIPLTPEEHEQFVLTCPAEPSAAEHEDDDTASVASSAFISNPDEVDDLAHRDDNEEVPPSPYARPPNPEPPATADGGHYEFDDDERDANAPHSCPYRRRETADSWTGLETTSWGEHFYIDEATSHLAVIRAWEAESGILHGRLQRCRFVLSRHRPAASSSSTNSAAPACPELKLTTPEGDEFWLDDSVQEREYDYEFVFRVGEYGHKCDERCREFFEEFGWELYPGDGESAAEDKDDAATQPREPEVEQEQAHQEREMPPPFGVRGPEEAEEDEEETMARMMAMEQEDAAAREVLRRNGLLIPEGFEGTDEELAVLLAKQGQEAMAEGLDEHLRRPSKKGKEAVMGMRKTGGRWTLVSPTVLETIPEEDEDAPEPSPALEDDDESVIEPVDQTMIDQLEQAVLSECEARKGAAQNKGKEKEKLPACSTEDFWSKDAFYVSGGNWADMMDEEEGY